MMPNKRRISDIPESIEQITEYIYKVKYSPFEPTEYMHANDMPELYKNIQGKQDEKVNFSSTDSTNN